MEATDYLLGIPMWARKKNSLADVRRFLERLGNPDRSMKILHVAGTNGKGSVCAFMTSVLVRAGCRTGTFLSPHLVDIRERFLLDGRMVGEEAFEAAFRTVRGLAQSMMEEGLCHPTYFEFLFLMAMVLFRDEGVEYVVLETGLGGRLDTTNVVERPLACVITSISLDHTEYLGNTLEAIAGEKAGIIKEGVPVVYDAGGEEAGAVIAERARLLHAPAITVRPTDFSGSFEGDGWRMRVPTPSGVGPVPGERQTELFVPFLAPCQQINALLAVRALEAAMPGLLSPADVAKGIGSARWPGRMEEGVPGVYLDGAHNPGGVRASAEAIRLVTARNGGPKVLLFAAAREKDYGEMADTLAGLGFDRVYVTRVSGDRGAGPERLKEAFARRLACPVEAVDGVGAAYSAALCAKGEDGLLFCVGSLYLIGEIKALQAGGPD